jgi:predicted RNA-binding Zn-ribbon protein involved in translation (DUF1610 family)
MAIEMETVQLEDQMTFDCPHCGATNEIYLDPSSRRQRIMEECQVCNREMDLRFEYDSGETMVHALAA